MSSACGTILVVYGPADSGKTYMIRKLTQPANVKGKVHGIVHLNSPPPREIPMPLDEKKPEGPKKLIQQGEWNVASSCKIDRLQKVAMPLDTTVVAVDDGHLFPDLLEMCMQWARLGMRVVVSVDAAAPDSAYIRPGHYVSTETIGMLLAQAESVVRLVCEECQSCGGKGAEFTIDSSHPSLVNPFTKQVGPMHVCRRCSNAALGRVYK